VLGAEPSREALSIRHNVVLPGRKILSDASVPWRAAGIFLTPMFLRAYTAGSFTETLLSLPAVPGIASWLVVTRAQPSLQD
jgi:hypothetical protein